MVVHYEIHNSDGNCGLYVNDKFIRWFPSKEDAEEYFNRTYVTVVYIR